MESATIKLFLITGNPNGLRTAELSNWSGKAIAAPRTELADLLNREKTKSKVLDEDSIVTGFNIGINVVEDNEGNNNLADEWT